MLACRLLGHRARFSWSGTVLEWRCARGCGAGGTRRYASEAQARRYATALAREDGDDLGRRPLLSLLPLALARRGRGG